MRSGFSYAEWEVSNRPPDFDDLAAQTDQRRIEFLRTDLDLCFTIASLAETEFDLGHTDAAEWSARNLEKDYATFRRFLSDPKHAKHITDEERRELTARLERLRAKLDGIGNPERGNDDHQSGAERRSSAH
jgi:hypothetical protein